MDATKVLVIGYMAFLLFFGCIDTGGNPSADSELKKFNSLDELNAFIEERQIHEDYRYDGIKYALTGEVGIADSMAIAPAMEGTASPSDYSQTNIQVQGVDEADFVKTDGDYLYIITGNKLVIMDAYPAVDAEILSETELDNPLEFFVNGDKLVIFEGDYDTTEILQYGISDRSNPSLEEEISVDGSYFDSRMIGNHVYVIVNEPVRYFLAWPEVPEVRINGFDKDLGFPGVYYFDEPAYSYRFTTVVSLDVESEEVESKIFLMGTAQELYVSQDNIYVVYEKVPDYESPVTDAVSEAVIVPEFTEQTAIHRLSIEDGEIEYAASGWVPGRVLNQFSMDEHKGYFRIATTTGHLARNAADATSSNNIYVLDGELEVVGELEDLAPGESIYSARFMGDRAYLVTFRKVDPLFVINMENPEEPEVLGKLKIPGYSDYLHPYDENHLIGIGKETVAADEGDFSWYQGVKISLFDVSDVENPKEISKYEIGDRGTTSLALDDHKAVLFSKSKNLLVIPILLAELDEEDYAGLDPWQQGDYVWEGAYVFSISPESGLKLKGRISHHEDDDSFLKSGHYYHSSYALKRSLYIEDVLYTVSDEKVKMNELNTLEEVNEVKLPYEEEAYPVYLE